MMADVQIGSAEAESIIRFDFWQAAGVVCCHVLTRNVLASFWKIKEFFYMSRSSKVSFLTIDRMSIHGWIGLSLTVWSMEGQGWSDSFFSSLNFLAFSGHFEELWLWSFVRSFFVNCLWYSHIWPVSDISFPEVFLSTRVCVFLVFFTKYLDMYFRNRISSFSRLSSRVIFEYASLFVKSVSGVCCVDVCYCAGENTWTAELFQNASSFAYLQ